MKFKGTLITGLLLFLLTVTGGYEVAAQGATVWQGQYYNNAVLDGPVEFTSITNEISFNWGFGSPAAEIDADEFSVRWSTDVNLPAGIYRFFARADDHVRVTVDFQPTPLIDTFNQNQVGQLVSADISLTEGSHHIQVDYQELTETAFVNVWYENTAQLTTVPPAQPTPPIIPSGQQWLAQYFGNRDLAGAPLLIRGEADPDANWGSGSPVGVPVDNWSARWLQTRFFDSGSYRISVRADDGVRVYVDGAPAIDEWHTASGLTYSTTVQLNAGQHSIQIEFYEGTGLALLDYDLSLIGSQQAPSENQATATVITDRLNVRNAPSVVEGEVLTRIDRGGVYPVLARNPEQTWVQVNVNGTIGWVNDNYVTLSGVTGLPEIGPPATPVPEGPLAIVDTGLLNVRRLPDPVNGEIITRIANGESYPVLARNPSNTWFLLSVNGTPGWVNNAYINTENVNVNVLPVATGLASEALSQSGPIPNATALFTVNIRSGPGVTFDDIGNLPVNATAIVVGRNASSTWWQINYNGVVGWVSDEFVQLDTDDVSAVAVTA